MNLYDPGTLKTFLGRHGLTATKGLGQHFLCSRPVVEAIVERLTGLAGVLEIGPGPGVLTGPISEKVSRFIALELDERMIQALAHSAPKADVRKADALKADLEATLRELPDPRGVVSNLPYYITGPLLTRIAEARHGYELAVLMMQKEVAQRVMASHRDSERGSLSVYLQTIFTISTVAQAPAGAFYPPPKVDSTVLQFVPKPTGLSPDEEPFYFRLVRTSFARPRKTLANNLMTGLQIGRDKALEAINSVGLKETARPQELTLDEWKALSRRLVLD